MVDITVKIDKKNLVAEIKSIKKRVSRFQEGVTKKMAINLKRLIKHKLQTRKRWGTPGARHNTPQPLIRSLHAQKVGKGHQRIFFTDVGSTNLAAMVEFGTKPHPQPFNPIWRKRTTHPGAKPMYFFRDAVNEMIRDMDGFVNNEARKIIK